MLTLLWLCTGALAAPGTQVLSVDGPIVVDGSLSEPLWRDATPLSDFTRYLPAEGADPPGTTEVRFLQDERFLYVGITVTGADYDLRARVSPREQINSDDQIGLYLDTFNNERTGYIFYFNPLGIQQDIRFDNGRWQSSWDAVFKSKGTVTEDGYVLEIAYPWRSLKYPRVDGDQDWGIIVTRKIPAQGAKYSHPVVERGHPRWFAQAAPLTGVRPAKRGSGVELVPAVTVIQQAEPTPAGDLSWTGFDPLKDSVRPSLDVRVGLTPSLGLTATLNPDFSQVEADVTRIDLNARYSLAYPERRPFFLEGDEFFVDRSETLYSRSIVDPLTGLKLAGREGPWSVGLLSTVDRRPAPSVSIDGTPGFRDEDVDGAQALNTIGRARRDVLDGGYVGLTVADKRLFGGSEASWSGAGLDAALPLGERWTAWVQHFESHVDAGPGAIWGMENGLAIERASGIGTGGGVSLLDRTIGLRKEMGFLTQPGATQASAWIDHTLEPKGALDTLTPSLAISGIREREGDHYAALEHGWAATLSGIHGLSVNGRVDQRTEQGLEVRGWGMDAGYRSELTRWLTVDTALAAGRELDFVTLSPAQRSQAETTLTLRPTAGIRVDTTLRAEHLEPEAGDTRDATLVRAKVAWQFTRTLGLRVVEDWSRGDTRDDQLLSSVLLTWLYHPGTAIYVGANERTLLEGSASTLERTVFLKASVWARP